MASTQWAETVDPAESQRHEQQAQLLGRVQAANASASGLGRALHNKCTGAVAGRFEVLADLPEQARVGLFASPGSYEAVVRFSNGAAGLQSDRQADVRGVGVKLFGVGGRKILPGLEDAQTQDFLLIHSPATPFRDSEEFVKLVWAARNPLLALPRLLWGLGVGRTFALAQRLRAGLSVPVPSVGVQQFWSALPIKFGDLAVRYTLVPDQQPPSGDGAGTPVDLREELADRLATEELSWTFCVQFFENEETTPIEDPAATWEPSDAPLVAVAQLVLPKQDIRSDVAESRAEEIEAMSFDPWHTTEDFRPLGEMMRARKVAYKVSSMNRSAAPEPS